MKIKTHNNTIGIICTREEETAAYNALLDTGVDPYLIHTESKNGKIAHVFMREDLPVDIARFEADFREFFEINMHPTVSLLHDIRDYFDVAAASIGGVRLTQFA